MIDTTEATTQIVKEVLRVAFPLSWANQDELDPEAKAIVRELPRIHSHRDAALAIRRVFDSSFGNGLRLDERELAFAGRLLVLRLSCAGLISSMQTTEGYTSEELLELVEGDLRETIFSGQPFVFTIGSAQVLGSFRVDGSTVIVELAHVDGGGEGVLPFLAGLIQKFATRNNIATIEWIVHALTCAAPNAKLRTVLERRGFRSGEHNNRPVLRLLEPAVPHSDIDEVRQ